MELDNWISKKHNLRDGFTKEELEEFQLNKLNDLIQYTKQNSVFYKKLYKDIDKINSLEELYKIPVINKNDLIENGNKMICVTQSDISRVVSLDTSGTMGKSKRLFFTQDDQNLTIDFFVQGLSLVAKKDDTMMIMLPFERENSVGDLIKKSLEIIGIKPITNGTLISFEDTIQRIINNNVSSIVGMPSEILSLARYIKYHNLKMNIKSILLSADMVSNTFVEEIQKILNCEVFNHLGMTEAGLGVAVDCKYHRGMHIRENDLLVEIVNTNTKERLKDGEYGEILITTLTRKAMPLIRYSTGDISSFVLGECKCNSNLKRLNKIKYRIEDRVHIGGNLFVNISDIDSNLFRLDNLMNYSAKIKNHQNYKILDLSIALFKINNINQDEEIIEDIKLLLLKNHKINKSYEINNLKIEIKIIHSDEYINFYKGKRKIIRE